MTHELEEQHGSRLADRQVADLVDDHQRGSSQNGQTTFQRADGTGREAILPKVLFHYAAREMWSMVVSRQVKLGKGG